MRSYSRLSRALGAMAAHTKKANAAKEQLEDGIRLFFEKRYLSSITLLGSAEEVFLRLLEERDGTDPIEPLWQQVNRIRTRLGNPHISKRELRRMSTESRNWLKHHTPGEPQTEYIDRFGEAFHMIQAATSFADQLGLRYRHRQEYRRWFNQSFGA